MDTEPAGEAGRQGSGAEGVLSWQVGKGAWRSVYV